MAGNKDKSKMIGVHTLSEFVFCARAGVISHEQQTDDSGIDDAFADLSYMPSYDIMSVEREIPLVKERMRKWAMAICIGLFVVLVVFFLLKPFLALLAFGAFLPVLAYGGIQLFKDWKHLARLISELKAYHAAANQRPDLANPDHEVISWLSLLKSCDVEKSHDQFVDEEIGLVGRPWKLLSSGELCFPVFRCKQPAPRHPELKGDPLASIYPQHIVRLRAYCHLIEHCTNSKSLCGIIVFSGTMTAIAIKFHENEKANVAFEKELESAREHLSQYDKTGTEAPGVNICRNCHLGRPRTYRLSTGTLLKNGIRKSPVLHQVKIKEKARSMHSTCGDFFDWIPPTETAAKLGLLTDQDAGK